MDRMWGYRGVSRPAVPGSLGGGSWPPAPAVSPVLCGNPGAARPLPQLSAYRSLALASETSWQVPRPRGQGRAQAAVPVRGEGGAECTRTRTAQMQALTPAQESPSCPAAQAAALGTGACGWGCWSARNTLPPVPASPASQNQVLHTLSTATATATEPQNRCEAGGAQGDPGRAGPDLKSGRGGTEGPQGRGRGSRRHGRPAASYTQCNPASGPAHPGAPP